MKRFLCIFMAIIIVFSAFSSAASAYSYNSNFISSEKDFGEVYFDCGYAEIGKELAVADVQNTVGTLLQVGNDMGGKKDGRAAGFQIQKDLRQLIAGNGIQSRGGFIEDE